MLHAFRHVDDHLFGRCPAPVVTVFRDMIGRVQRLIQLPVLGIRGRSRRALRRVISSSALSFSIPDSGSQLKRELRNHFLAKPLDVFDVGLTAGMRQFDHRPGHPDSSELVHRSDICSGACTSPIFSLDLEPIAISNGPFCRLRPHFGNLLDVFAQLLDGLNAGFLIGRGHGRRGKEGPPAIARSAARFIAAGCRRRSRSAVAVASGAARFRSR